MYGCLLGEIKDKVTMKVNVLTVADGGQNRSSPGSLVMMCRDFKRKTGHEVLRCNGVQCLGSALGSSRSIIKKHVLFSFARELVPCDA